MKRTSDGGSGWGAGMAAVALAVCMAGGANPLNGQITGIQLEPIWSLNLPEGTFSSWEVLPNAGEAMQVAMIMQDSQHPQLYRACLIKEGQIVCSRDIGAAPAYVKAFDFDCDGTYSLFVFHYAYDDTSYSLDGDSLGYERTYGYAPHGNDHCYPAAPAQEGEEMQMYVARNVSSNWGDERWGGASNGGDIRLVSLQSGAQIGDSANFGCLVGGEVLDWDGDGQSEFVGASYSYVAEWRMGGNGYFREDTRDYVSSYSRHGQNSSTEILENVQPESPNYCMTMDTTGGLHEGFHYRDGLGFARMRMNDFAILDTFPSSRDHCDALHVIRFRIHDEELRLLQAGAFDFDGGVGKWWNICYYNIENSGELAATDSLWNLSDFTVGDFNNDGEDEILLRYEDRIVCAKFSAELGVEPGEAIIVPNRIAISAFPNPFNSTTELSYSLPQTAKVTLGIFDVQGREVRKLIDFNQNAGTYKVRLEAGDLPAGEYYARLNAGDFSAAQKVVLVK